MRHFVHSGVVQFNVTLKFMFTSMPPSYEHLPSHRSTRHSLDMKSGPKINKCTKMNLQEEWRAGSKRVDKGEHFLYGVEAVWQQINYTGSLLGYTVIEEW